MLTFVEENRVYTAGTLNAVVSPYNAPDEKFNDDPAGTVNFAAKAKKQGDEVTLLEYEGMCHAFPILAPLFPEATDAMAKICAFMRTRLAHSAPVAAGVA